MEQLVARLGLGVCDDGFISADDLGVNRGDGCFDATLVRVEGGKASADFVDVHLERLANSARLLDMDPIPADGWRELTAEALDAWASRGGAEAVCKYIHTRGQETVPAGPLGFITITELSAKRIAARESATAVTLSAGRRADALNDAPWLLGGAKTLSYGTNMAYVREAHRRGATDPVLVTTDGFVLEGPQSGILVLKDGLLFTTPVEATGILDSITVRHAIEGWERLGRPVAHELYTPEELFTADAVWLASSVRGVTPMVQLEGRDLPQDREVTEELRALVRP
ncbi:MAG: aminotransferase class IV [Propionibacteriaceae bacterium]|nr:aminotransferase class IV [Propionibacteriaceae bacterium]